MKKVWFIFYCWYSVMEENGINLILFLNLDLFILLKNGISCYDDCLFVVWILSFIVVIVILIIIFNMFVVFIFLR